ncbi:hypothetical protein ACS0PU_006900 [Formica fusca]
MEIKSIDTTQLACERLAVKITHVESPLLFWMRLRDNERDLENLEEDLNFQMTGCVNLPLESRKIKRRKAVAVKDDGFWHRGLITKITGTRDMVEVFLKDIGTKIILPIHEIYKLEDEFKELP